MIFKRIFTLTFVSLSCLMAMATPHIVVDKPKLRLYVIENSDTLLNVPICVGKNKGNKTRRGDHKTPEGKFAISGIYNSTSWKHDFKDGKGLVAGAYGPWFFRLNSSKWFHIGIHGTCYHKTIGTRDSDGCIRLKNEDLNQLKNYVNIGTKVVILPDKLP